MDIADTWDNILDAPSDGVHRSEGSKVSNKSSNFGACRSSDTRDTAKNSVAGALAALNSGTTGNGVRKKKSMDKLVLNLHATHDFFTSLNFRQQELFAILTDDIPMNKNAGLNSVGRRLWKGKELRTMLGFAVMLIKLALNFYMSIYNLQMAAQSDLGMSGSEITVIAQTLHICSTRLENMERGCLVTPSLPSKVWRVFLITEALIALLLMLHVVGHALYLVLCRCIVAQTSAANLYFDLLALPRIASKFSLLMFLHLASLDRLVAFFFRGDIRCLAAVCKSGLWRRKDTGLRVFWGVFLAPAAVTPQVHPSGPEDDAADSDQEVIPTDCSFRQDGTSGDLLKSKTAVKNPWLWDIMGLCMCMFFIFVCFHMLLMKLTIVYFACLFSPYGHWTFLEYIRFFGFVNQLSGASLSSEVEMLRVLLFKFGGEKSVWSGDGIEACDVYFQYLAFQIVKQIGRTRGLMVLWTLGSEQLQQLFLGHARAKCQDSVRGQCVEMYHNLDNKENLENMRDKMVRRFSKSVQLFQERLEPVPGEKRLAVCDQIQRRAIGELRLAAKIQEFIWEYEKDAVGYGKSITPTKSSSG